MRLNIGGVERQAASTSSYVFRLTQVNFTYTVVAADLDADEDGLIDIDSLDKLNAMRWDLDGDGAVTGGNATSYEAAFPGAAAGMGCPDGSDADDTPDACTGYELTTDLDFDTDGSGATWTGTVTSPSGDPNDAYYNNGGGLVGQNQGRVAAVWVTGNVLGGAVVGGMMGVNVTAFQIPTATHADAVTYEVSGLPPGLTFDAGGCTAADFPPGTAACMVSFCWSKGAS